jgi:predicted amidohydrolase
MIEEDLEKELLERAQSEEKHYNWRAAAKIYNQIIENLLKKNKIDKIAQLYKTIGYVNQRASYIADSKDEYLKYINLTIEAYKKAKNLFKKIKNKAEELECEAELIFFSGFKANSVMEAKENFYHSYEVFIESSQQFSKKNDQERVARILGRASIVSWFLLSHCSDRNEIDKILKDSRDIIDKAWKISKETGNISSLADVLLAKGGVGFIESFIFPFRYDKSWKEHYKDIVSMCDESLEISKDYYDSRVLGIIYGTAGRSYGFYGVQFIEDENEQRKIITRGLELCEKGIECANKSNDKQVILWSLFWLIWWAWLGGRFEYIQKRVFFDLHNIEELGRIYENLYTIWTFYSKFLLTFYYTNVAQRSFFTPIQRKKYAKKGIKYAKEVLHFSSYSPFAAWPYQMLTWCYSQLAILSKTKEIRKNHGQEMLKYANEAQKISEKFEGGLSRAAGYSSLYRAYKTLTDISDSKIKKIEMLTATINAQKKYITHAMEGRTGLIAAQMRLGFLYEELGIITEEIDPLMQARKTFLIVIKDCLTKGYNSYAAATHEYIAHIEDRIGNHKAAAEHYKEAKKTYTNSLKAIKYKLLKDRIKEKINYTQAWTLIEMAKNHHKREEHSRARENYKQACDILKGLPSYNYEEPYYSAWIYQEEAEELSKQENHEKAIENYDKTKNVFKVSITTLEKILQQSKDKIEKSRIEKLKKLADIRIHYCSARINVEEARILGKTGKHQIAAEKFFTAASKLSEVCSHFHNEREREELKAVYYLCRAWENMELAENYGDPKKFEQAANLFEKASEKFLENKMKLLSLGNSNFCRALEYGCKFDETIETQLKAEIYPKIKVILRKAAKLYKKGGFDNEGDWALATSIYFDATWHLIRADEEMRLNEKKNLLKVGLEFLKSASELFNKAGYKHKQKEILELMDLISKEEKILISALNTIREPSISRSTLGFAAPACPIETNQAPRISEVRQFTEEAIKIIKEKTTKKKYQIIYKDLLKEATKRERKIFRIGIAQIGLSKSGDILNELFEIKESGLLGIQENMIKLIKSSYKQMIEKAIKNKVNILIFPEMMIDLNFNEIIEELINYAKNYTMYIIPGSFHQEATMRNISTVIGPEGIIWEQEKHIPAMITLGKKRVKESIEVSPSPKKIIVCNTEFGRIAIIICRDFLDMDLRVELKNFEPPIDIIINPAFTPVTADFKATHFDARRSIYAYCFFANVAEFGGSLIYTPEKERIERNIPPKEEGLIYKDIELFRLRSERKRWEKEQEKELKFIQSTKY